MPKMTKKKAIGNYDKKSVRIGIHKWNLDAASELLEEIVSERIKQAMEIATEEYKVEAYFQFGSSQKAEDPATIFVELPLGFAEFENPRWSFKLTDIIADMIELAEVETSALDEDDRPPFIAVRDRLRQLADVLDEVIGRDNKK
jgi:hypothetical protein